MAFRLQRQRLLLAATFAAAMAASAFAQQPMPRVKLAVPAAAPGARVSSPPAAAQPEQQLSEAVSIGYVMIPFTAAGAHGAVVTNVAENDVRLYVDGEQVKSDFFEKSQNAPVSFTILFDASGSMGLAGKLDSARAAVSALLSQRMSGDDFSLWVFADGQAKEAVPFTDDPNAILRALGNVKPFGKTAFFDALAQMPERSRLGRNGSRAIILLSDGIDNYSQLTRHDLERLLEGVAIPIYSLGLREAEPEHHGGSSVAESSSDLDLLREVASLTGGRLYVGNEPEQLRLAIDGIERELRAQYLIGFSPTGKGTVQYRHISLKLPGRVQTIHVRAGYRGTEPPVMHATASAAADKNAPKKGSR
jgi:VWFA-related protein